MRTLLALTALLLATSTHAQPTQPTPTPTPPHTSPAEPPPAPAPDQPQALDITKFPPPMRAGVRVELVRRRLAIIPTLVIVDNTRDYLKAMAAWSIKERFPVLLDDGSVESREGIARFVRGFKPAAVVRWSSGDKPTPIPNDELRTQAHQIIAHAWDFKPDNNDLAPLMKYWIESLGLAPPGIVVADPNDPAWTAAVPIAAFRGEPICWMDLPPPYRTGPGGLFETAQLDPIATHIEKFADSTNLPWREMGDAIDAVALCLNIPSRGQIPGAKPYDMFTLSYRIGRTGTPPHYSASKWAAASQIFGNESQCAYQAMCGLFLQSRQAWLFDGYDDQPPFNAYDCTKAANLFKQAKFETTLLDTPKNSSGLWRSLASRPIPAGVVMVNSSGEKDDFNLQPGKLRSADTPFPIEPALVYFVHSWSASLPADHTTIAARWFERGAYAYFGSAQEPYLQSFLVTPDVAGRLLSSVPWAAATRWDDLNSQAPVWKLSCFGDPLITMGPPAPKATVPLPLEGAKNLQDDLAPALKDGKFAEAMTILTLTGRDEDASKLADALLTDQPEKFTPDVAAAAVMPLFRTARAASMFKAFDIATTGRVIAAKDADKAPATDAKAADPAASKPIKPDESWKDAIWLAAYPTLYTTSDRIMLECLKACIRPDNAERDFDELANAWARATSKNAALSMLQSVLTSAPSPDMKAKATAALQKYRTQWH